MAFSGLLLAVAGIAAAEPLTVDWLPRGTLEAARPADPWQPRAALGVRSGGPRLLGEVGEIVPLARVDGARASVEVALSAAVFLGFLPGGDLTFGVATVDGLVEVPVTVAGGDLAVTLAWAHLSSHYADGVRYLDEAPAERAPHSRETVRLIVARRTGWWRPYAGFREILHAVPEAPRPGVQAGVTLEPAGPVAPFLAVDARWEADTGWRSGLAARAGARVGGEAARPLRVGAMAWTGPRWQGMLADQDDAFVGAFLAFETEEASP